MCPSPGESRGRRAPGEEDPAWERTAFAVGGEVRELLKNGAIRYIIPVPSVQFISRLVEDPYVVPLPAEGFLLHAGGSAERLEGSLQKERMAREKVPEDLQNPLRLEEERVGRIHEDDLVPPEQARQQFRQLRLLLADVLVGQELVPEVEAVARMIGDSLLIEACVCVLEAGDESRLVGLFLRRRVVFSSSRPMSRQEKRTQGMGASAPAKAVDIAGPDEGFLHGLVKSVNCRASSMPLCGGSSTGGAVSNIVEACRR